LTLRDETAQYRRLHGTFRQQNLGRRPGDVIATALGNTASDMAIPPDS
jgi:hypothetical protein